MRYLTIALAKGRLADFSVSLFEKIGLDVSDMRKSSRKLIFTDDVHMVRFILVKAADVPVYVEYGAADLGIVGRDTVLEEGREVYELLDLGFGACKMSVAAREGTTPEMLKGHGLLKVASKYPAIARDHFQSRLGINVELIKLSGSVELAPLVGLSDVIVDIVESGKTLVENGLCVVEDICPLSARLIANRVSLKLEKERILQITKGLKENI